MKIGVWLRPNYKPTVGGGFSYYDRLINGIDNYNFAKDLEVCFITTNHTTQNLNRQIINLTFSPVVSFKEKVKCHVPFFSDKNRRLLSSKIDCQRLEHYSKILKDNDVSLIFYPTPYMYVIPDYPFITAHWDIGHRSTYTFPEVVQGAEFGERENFYNNIMPRALLVFSESEAGRQELITYTNINPNRIKIVPLFAGLCSSKNEASNHLSVIHKYRLESNHYFYYPAQFWAHKNHYTLIRAFSLLKNEFPEYKLLLTGSDQGNMDYIRNVVDDLCINDSVVFAGFVSNEEVNMFYHNATALVMPTLMGPTNMPLLEAMEIGCPVICSDFPGHREELADAAIYIDPMSPASIFQAMKTMIIKQDEYRLRIKDQCSKSVFHLQNTLDAINSHFLYAMSIRNCWGL